MYPPVSENNILIVGKGKLGTQLALALSRNKLAAVRFAEHASAIHSHPELSQLASARPQDFADGFFDLAFFCVRDQQISDALAIWSGKSKAHVHCSGASDIGVLKGPVPAGVFYPIQTFSQGIEVSWKNIPVCIEAVRDDLLQKLFSLAIAIGAEPHAINSLQRCSLHTAAVFCNNFTNHLLNIAEKICLENRVDYNWLKPLIEETIRKANLNGPAKSQTGPALRRDFNTMQAHLKTLQKHPDWQEIYTLLSSAIQKQYS